MSILDFRNELKQMIVSADSTVHKISQYKLSYRQVYYIWTDLIQGECLINYQAYAGVQLKTTQLNGYVQTIYIYNIDNDYFNRLNSMKNTIAIIIAGIDNQMTDLEKVLYVHDYIIDTTIYRRDAYVCYSASGPLGKGYGVCEGYTNAIRLILTLLNIENSYIVSTTMNHKWLYVKIDGEWYHVDTTWDDTKSSKTGLVSHTFFLRNDEEFTKATTNKHYDWYNPTQTTSLSTKYTLWYVHNVIGRMLYYDGYWYYMDYNGNGIVRSKIDGTNYQVIMYGDTTTSSLKLDKIVGRKLQYYQNGNLLSIDLDHIPVPDPLLTISSIALINHTNISQINFMDLSNWRSGYYSATTGMYVADTTRLCLKYYLECTPKTSYTIITTVKPYFVVIRSIDENFKVIKSSTYTQSGTFLTVENAKYFAIFIYGPSTSIITFEKYKELFGNGYQINIQ